MIKSFDKKISQGSNEISLVFYQLKNTLPIYLQKFMTS